MKNRPEKCSAGCGITEHKRFALVIARVMDLTIRLLVQDPEASTASFGNVRVRYICEWNQHCELSNTFGEGDLAWTKSSTEEEQPALFAMVAVPSQ